jgi:nucleotide-binding universal stress UspA family protein
MASFTRILVATDGSPSCARAADAAIELAGALGAELLALSVARGPQAEDADLVAPSDPLGAAEAATMALTRDDEAAVEAAAAGHAHELASRAAAAGVTARAITWEGAAGDAILAAAAAEGADLIVIGSHCKGRLGRLVSGSVSDHVVHHATLPVLLVR